MIEVEIEDAAWSAADPAVCALALAAANAALDAGGARPAHHQRGVTVLLSSDATVRDLNARFRGKNAATNVLAFPAAANPEHHVGDIALAFGVCAREAAEQGVSLADHLQHLVAHGVLHLLGYDHQDDAEAAAMEALERQILAGLGVADPYADEQGADG